MKKVIISIVFLLIFQATAFPQCLPEGITLNTQEQIDNFQTNFPGCTAIEGNVLIQGGSITNLNGLSVLISIEGSLNIQSNNTLTNLAGLENLTSIGGNLSILINRNLNSLLGLDKLISISGYFEIWNNKALTSLIGLNNLTSVGRGLVIGENIALTTLSGLDKLNSIGGELTILSNDVLTNLSGLDSLESIGGDLRIIGSNALSSLTGLNNLTSIEGDLFVFFNKVLVDISSLDKLITLKGNLEIFDNVALTDLTGLDNIAAETIDSLFITGNYKLSTCDVQSICNYLASPNGYIDIRLNATGCNSQHEVEEACLESVAELPLSYLLSVHPNPFSTSTTIEYKLQKSSAIQITIYNHLGKQLKVIQQKQASGDQQVTLNAEGFRSGVYYFTLQAGEQIASGKMIIVK
jgi:hypothetical protein